MDLQPEVERGRPMRYATVPISTVGEIIEQWPALAQKAVREMVDKYGFPHEATASRLIWFDCGPWKRAIVYRDEVLHNFPQPHYDVLEQVIDYQVPLDKVGELAKFDGSIIVDRTKGEVSARCDMEAANILALNLMHEIASGMLSAEEARREHANQTARYMLNRPAPYVERLQFAVSHHSMIDPDETVIAPVTLEREAEKMKNSYRRSHHPH